ncbi:MAG: hypothetical protein H6807_14220 [Planctomycetes bacterium]|nr:hypothetical protein [Planctomycetota bacterium]
MDIHLKHEVDRIVSAGGLAAAEHANDLMVDYLVARGFVTGAALEQALRAQPRHAFLPGVPLATVYQDRAVTTALDDLGWFDSSCSTPSIVCLMTEALELAADSRVLEIGAGTGWTAALMAEIAHQGTIVALEILPELAAASRARLDLRLPGRVDLRCADGLGGSAGPGPYDRIVFACGTTGIPRPIADLLTEDGRMVVPVGHFLHSFRRQGAAFVGRPIGVATFIAFRDGRPCRSWRTHTDRAVLLADDHVGLATALAGPAGAETAGPELDPAQLETLLYWLALEEPRGHFLLADRGGGWGLGLVAEDGHSAAALLCRGAFTFRHYQAGLEETRLALWGGEEAGERLFALCERIAGLGWPRLADLEIVTEERPGAVLEAEVGDDRWWLIQAAAAVSSP